MEMSFDATLTQRIATIAMAENKTEGEVIRDALCVYDFLKKEMLKNVDIKLVLTDKELKPIKEIVLP